MDGILLFSARNDHDLYDCASKRRTGEFSTLYIHRFFFVNILFNYMFIFGKLGVPRMEVEGAGVGTLIARVFEFSLICGYFVCRSQDRLSTEGFADEM